MPNSFTFGVSEVDHEQLADYFGALRRELADAVREHARDEGYVFVGPIEVDIDPMANLRTGQMSREGALRRGRGRSRRPDRCVLPTGERVPLGEYTCRSGASTTARSSSAIPTSVATMPRSGPSVDGFVVADLGSTNGTKVNGVRVAEQQLRDGDEVRFGNTVMHFEAS